MGVSFLLNKPLSKRTSIRIKVSIEGTHIMLYPGISIDSKDWDSKKSFVKTSTNRNSMNKIGKHLRALEAQIQEILDDYKWSNTKFGFQELKQRLALLISNPRVKGFKGQQLNADAGTWDTLMMMFIDECKSGQRLNPQGQKIQESTILDYNKTFKKFKSFLTSIAFNGSIPSIGQEQIDQFSDFLIIDNGLSKNTHGKMQTHLKQLFKYAVKQKTYPSERFDELSFDTRTEETDSIYLSESEILELLALSDFESDKYEQVRDLFVVGCFTAMRFSDYSMIDPKAIRNDKFVYIQKKTGTKTTIPIHPVVKSILHKYDYNLPYMKYDEFNSLIKVIGKSLPSLNVPFTKQITYARAKEAQTKDRWEFLQTHTARRSFCTNEYLRGTDPLTIMSISGHKTEASFLKYIKVTKEQQAERLAKIWSTRETEQ